jgi:hypothetical protein
MQSTETGPTERLPTSAGGDRALPQETVFDILRNRRRRYALHHLKQRETPVSIGELAEQVAAWEYDTTPEEISSQQRQRVYVSLVQSHLPMMEDEGVIAVDDDTVTLTEGAAALDVYLEVVPENDIAWAQYYLGITGLNAALLLVALADVPLLAGAPDGLWAVTVALLFLVAAAIHHWYHRQTRLGVEGPPPS